MYSSFSPRVLQTCTVATQAVPEAGGPSQFSKVPTAADIEGGRHHHHHHQVHRHYHHVHHRHHQIVNNFVLRVLVRF